MRSNQKRKAPSRLKGMAQLWRASERGDARTVAALLDGDRTSVAVNHAGEWGWTPLFVASERGHLEVVSMLLAKQGVDVNQAANLSLIHI